MVFASVYLCLINGLFVIFAAATTCCSIDDAISDKCLDVAWSIHMLFASIMLFVVSILIPSAILISDTCYVMGDLPSDMPAYTSSFLAFNTSTFTIAAAEMVTAAVPNNPFTLNTGFAIPGPTALLEACMNPNAAFPASEQGTQLFDTLYGPAFMGESDSLHTMDFAALDAIGTLADADGFIGKFTEYEKVLYLLNDLIQDGENAACLTNSQTTDDNGANDVVSLWSMMDEYNTANTWYPDAKQLNENDNNGNNNDNAPFLEQMYRRNVWMNEAILPLQQASLAARARSAEGGGCGFFREQYDEVIGWLCEGSLGGLDKLVNALIVITALAWPMAITAIFIVTHGDSQISPEH